MRSCPIARRSVLENCLTPPTLLRRFPSATAVFLSLGLGKLDIANQAEGWVTPAHTHSGLTALLDRSHEEWRGQGAPPHEIAPLAGIPLKCYSGPHESAINSVRLL